VARAEPKRDRPQNPSLAIAAPLPKSKNRAGQHHGEMPCRRRLNIRNRHDLNASDEHRDHRSLDSDPAIKLLDHFWRSCAPRSPKAGTAILIARILLADVSVALAVELVDPLAGSAKIEIGHLPATTTASGPRDERRPECSGSLTYSSRSRRRAAVCRPVWASQRRSVLHDPDISDTIRGPSPSRDVGPVVCILSAQQRFAFGDFDQHFDRIGAGSLVIEGAGGANRLPSLLSGTWSASR